MRLTWKSLMFTFIKNISIRKEQYKLVTLSEDAIKAFFRNEIKTHIKLCTEHDNSMYLCYNVADFSLTDTYAIVKDNIVCAFCLKPRYANGVAMRLYTSPDFRRKGLGSTLLKECKIKTLSCLVENKGAIAFYEKQGFKIERKTDYLVDFKK